MFATGVLWLTFHYFVQVEGQFGPSPHPLEQWWLRLHGGAAMISLVVVGSLLPIHIRRGWHMRRNVLAGVSLSSMLVVLMLTGYALYYFGDERGRVWISAFHWCIGVAGPLILLWHIVSGRRATLAKQQPPQAQADRDRLSYRKDTP